MTTSPDIGPWDEELQALTRDIYDHTAPADWNASVWLPNTNYVTGRIDVADAHRLIRLVLTTIRDSDG